MEWHLFTIGKPKLAYAAAGMAEYALRLRPFAEVHLHHLKSPGPDKESDLLLEKSVGMFRVVLDETGTAVRSTDLAARLDRWELEGRRRIALLIGGAEGHRPGLLQEAGWVWSLGPATMQHELAAVVLLEQLYRAHTIKRGLPYHREG
jgi:23S rRNA (pseudouridine1915-N3)-methyltransferase